MILSGYFRNYLIRVPEQFISAKLFLFSKIFLNPETLTRGDFLAVKQFFRSSIDSSIDLKTNRQTQNAQSKKSKLQRKTNGKHKQR